MTEQGYPPGQPDHPGRYGRSRTSQEPRRSGWQLLGAFEASAEPEADVPPWAIPGGIDPIRPARRSPRAGAAEPPLAEPELTEEPGRDEPARGGRRSGRSRVAAARRRRSKRRLEVWGLVLVVAAVIVTAVYFLNRPAAQSGPVTITTLQKGEYGTVPDACHVLSTAALGTYLAGKPKSIQPFNYPAQSQCTYTVDAKPTFRILNLTVLACQPNLNVPGDGSATTYAAYSFAQDRKLLAKPPKATPQPPAAITSLRGLGNVALSAVQVYHASAVTDRVTVLVRYHNVLITASLEAQASGGFGPVSISQLQAGALAAANYALVQVKVETAVGS